MIEVEGGYIEDSALGNADVSHLSPSHYSVARQRARLQLEAAMACNTLELAIPRLERALEEAKQADLDGLDPYMEVLEELRIRMASDIARMESSAGLPFSPPPATSMQTITPRALPIAPAEIRARIEAQAAGVVGVLTLTNDGVAELRDAAELARVVQNVRVFDPATFSNFPQTAPYPVLQSAGRSRGGAPAGQHPYASSGPGNRVGSLQGSGVFMVEEQSTVVAGAGVSRDSFDHTALEEFLEDPSMPFARLVAVVDPLQGGSLLLASQLLRGGPRARLNGVVYALPGVYSDASVAGPPTASLSAFLSLGGEDLGIGRGRSGCLFQRAVAIVERTDLAAHLAANGSGLPDSIGRLAFQLAAVGTQVEQSPALCGQWIFDPPDLVEVEEPPKPLAPPTEEGEGEEVAPPPAEEEGEQENAIQKPKPPELFKVAFDVHSWLWRGFTECYKPENRSVCVDPFLAAGVTEAEIMGAFSWLERTEQSGFWGPVCGVVAQRVQQDKDLVNSVKEERLARKEEKRQQKLREEALKQQAEAEAQAAAEPPAEE